MKRKGLELDLEGIMLTKISKMEKDECHMTSLICGRFLKTNNKQTHRYEKQIDGYQKGREVQRGRKG